MITANGFPVIEMRLTMPLSGLWACSLDVAAEEALTGALTLEHEDSATTFAGYILRSGVVAGSCKLDAIGGAGGFARDVTARSFKDATARDVLADTLTELGETLDASSTRSTLAELLSFWTRATTRGPLALWQLADNLSAHWRVLPSGSTWMGIESWPAAPKLEMVEIDRDHAGESVLVAPETFDLLPGMLLDNGDRVGRIIYSVFRDEHLRATYWLEGA